MPGTGNERGRGGESRENGQAGQVVPCRGNVSLGVQPPVLHPTELQNWLKRKVGQMEGRSRGEAPRPALLKGAAAEQLPEETFQV